MISTRVHSRRPQRIRDIPVAGPIEVIWANRRLLLRAGGTLSDRARNRLSTVFATDDATGRFQAAWLVTEQLRTLLATGSLADAADVKDYLQALVEHAAQPETNLL